MFGIMVLYDNELICYELFVLPAFVVNRLC